jgi:ribosomal protein S18 acetylase RimI-like enzyme
MLELARGLSPAALREAAELERRVVAVDGGRLKLEWMVLRNRPGHAVEDLLWWEDDRLLGFLGLYAFAGATVEIAGMVDPATRRRGIATALLDAALPLCRARGYVRALLVTPRGPAGGSEFARGRGAVLDHSEHALVLDGAIAEAPAGSAITLRTATPADAPELSRLLAAAFGTPVFDIGERLIDEAARTVVVKRARVVVGTIRVTREDDDTAGIYGFAVDPAWQGRGIGREVLHRVCRELRDEGVKRIGLEVAVENDHALGLYTSLGFVRSTTEDYYELPLD